MSTIRRFLSGSVAGMALVALTLPAVAQTSLPSRTAKVLRVQGSARASFDNKTWQTLKKGSSIPAGTVIQTAEGAIVEISLGGGDAMKTGNSIRLSGDSVLRVDQLGGTEGGIEDTELDLRTGSLNVRAGVVAKGSRFEVKFADGIVGVRSGDFTMNTLGLVDVNEGKIVAAMFRDAKPQVVTGGHHFDATTGQISDLVYKSISEAPAAKPVTPGNSSRKF